MNSTSIQTNSSMLELTAASCVYLMSTRLTRAELWEVQSQTEFCNCALACFWYENHLDAKVRLARASTNTNSMMRFQLN